MTNIDRHSMICKELTALYERKNIDYGDSFHKSYEKYGAVMSAIRLGDKFSRFESLIGKDAKVKNESIRDTLIDLANYAIMTVMELDMLEKCDVAAVGTGTKWAKEDHIPPLAKVEAKPLPGIAMNSDYNVFSTLRGL